MRQGTVHIDALTEEHRLPHIVTSDSVWVIFSVSAIRLQDDVIPDPFITKTCSLTPVAPRAVLTAVARFAALSASVGRKFGA